MTCGWEVNRRTGDASQTSVVYPPAGSRLKERTWAPRLHSSWGMAHFRTKSESCDCCLSCTQKARRVVVHPASSHCTAMSCQSASSLSTAYQRWNIAPLRLEQQIRQPSFQAPVVGRASGRHRTDIRRRAVRFMAGTARWTEDLARRRPATVGLRPLDRCRLGVRCPATGPRL